MPLSLSPELREGFLELAALGEPEYAAIVKSIAERKPSMYPLENSWWPHEIGGVAPSTFEKIKEAILTLRWWIADKSDGPSESSIRDVSAQTAERGGLDAKQAERLENRIGELLSIRSLSISSRAYFLAFANPNSLVRSRVITDIRPVFESAKSTDIAGMLILHDLQFQCAAGGGDVDNLYITLDGRDLKKLIEQLQRAEAKGEALTSMLKRAEVDVIPATIAEDK